MSDEIKEILDRLERIDHKEYNAFEFADSATFNEMARCFEERKKIANYITNLQTIEREYSNLLSENAELQQKYDKALSDLVKESHKRIKGE